MSELTRTSGPNIMQSVREALHAAHQEGIIHRDVDLEIGTAEEAHQLHEELLNGMMVDMLSEDICDQYGDEYREYLESALTER